MKIAEKQYFGTRQENVHFPPLTVFKSKGICNQEITDNGKWYLFIKRMLTEV